MQYFRSVLLSSVTLALALGVALPTAAQAQTAQICLSSQTRVAGTLGRGAMRCFSKAMKKGLPVDPACIAEREAKLTSKYASAESASPCLTEPASATVWGTLQPLVVSLGNALSLNGGRCAAKKMGALGNELKQLLRCYAYVAETSAAAVDPQCLVSAQSKLSSAFTNYEAQYACVTTGDATALSGDTSTTSDTIFSYLRGTGTTTTSTTTTTTSTSTTSTTLPPGVCDQSGGDSACIAYTDDPACQACVDATLGANAGVATAICTDAGPDCSDETLNLGCGFAINTATTCGAVCCP